MDGMESSWKVNAPHPPSSFWPTPPPPPCFLLVGLLYLSNQIGSRFATQVCLVVVTQTLDKFALFSPPSLRSAIVDGIGNFFFVPRTCFALWRSQKLLLFFSVSLILVFVLVAVAAAVREMEKEEKSQKGTSRAAETDFVLQWGSRKRLRCAKLKKRQNLNSKSPDCSGGKKKLNCRSVAVAAAEKDDSCSFPLHLPQRLNK